MVRQRVRYRGEVQGVGFRWTARRLSGQFRVSGYVRNLGDGSVELEAQGESAEVNMFLAAVRERLGDYIRKEEVEEAAVEVGARGFEIR